ncbi:MAG: response regulator transcription factor [Verrucomicrobiia bacterium]
MDKRNHKPKHVLLIDDHPVCRHGLERIFNNSNEFSFDEFSTSVDDAVQPKQEPDIVALDIAIAKCKGMAGANGYLMKTASKEALIKAFHEMAEGHLHVSNRIRSRILNRVSGYSSELDETPHVDRLSDRELLIVQHISQSKNNQEIAQELQISQKTIESHRSRIKSKLELDSPHELIRFAMRLRTALA